MTSKDVLMEMQRLRVRGEEMAQRAREQYGISEATWEHYAVYDLYIHLISSYSQLRLAEAMEKQHCGD